MRSVACALFPPTPAVFTSTFPGRLELLTLAHPDDLAHIEAEWQEAREQSAARGGEPVTWTFTCRLRRTDGSFVWTETSACISPTHWYGITHDITDQKRLEVRAHRARCHLHASADFRAGCLCRRR